MKAFLQNGQGSTATLQEANPSKIRVFDTYEDAEASLSDINENEIICIKEASDEQVRDATVPVGTIVSYLSDNIPDGWLLCDGSDIPEKYTRLRELYGTATPVSISYPESNPQAEDITSSVNILVGTAKVVRVGNVIQVTGQTPIQSTSGNTLTISGLPKALSVNGFVYGSLTYGSGSVGYARIDSYSTVVVSASTSHAGSYAITYITDEYDGTSHYNIIKAAPNQSEVQDIEMNIPVGTVISYRGQTTPVGFLRADGSTFDKDKYPLLYTALGNSNTLPTEIEVTPETYPESTNRSTLYHETIDSGTSFTKENTVIAPADGTVLFQVSATNNNGVHDQAIYAWVDNKCVAGYNCYQVNTYYPEHMFWFKVKKGQEIRTRVHMTANTFADDGSYRAASIYLYLYENADIKYKYIKATSGIDAEEETIATAVNEAMKWHSLGRIYLSTGQTPSFSLPSTYKELLIMCGTPYYQNSYTVPYDAMQTMGHFTTSFIGGMSGSVIMQQVIFTLSRTGSVGSVNILQNGSASTGFIEVFYR